MPKVRKISREEAERDERKLALGEQPTQAAMPVKTSQIDATAYPRLSDWVSSRGWVELGLDMETRTHIRILDQGGLVWESVMRYQTIEDLLRAGEQALVRLENAGS
ncbi:hypothetical protein F8S13_13795 [Chloroflexia bacterium SDU3-3]|nr:hypothetical protein F8S13_13795 [Chloroflexia bacterium SDU3-3]